MQRVQHLFGFLILLLVVGCGNASPAEEAAQDTSADTPPTPTPQTIPTPGEDTAVVHGQLFDVDTGDPLSIADGVDVFLAPVTENEDGTIRMAGLDMNRDPTSTVDLDGRFVFESIEPGEYALVALTPLNTILTRYQDNPEQDVVIITEAGETLDVGEVIARYHRQEQDTTPEASPEEEGTPAEDE